MAEMASGQETRQHFNSGAAAARKRSGMNLAEDQVIYLISAQVSHEIERFAPFLLKSSSHE